MKHVGRQPPSPAKWAYMQEIGRVRYIAMTAGIGALVVSWGAVVVALAVDGPVAWAALGAAFAGALCGWSRGYTDWLIAQCAYDRAGRSTASTSV